MMHTKTFSFFKVWILYMLYTVYATNIGDYCQTDMDCQTGNGGQYSACNKYSSVCVCIYDYLGKGVKPELYKDTNNQNNRKCDHINECTKHEGCSIKCTQEWWTDTNRDWYGALPDPFVSDHIPDTNTSVCYDPDRAVSSRPKGIVITKSGIPEAGLGVFTEEYIPRGSVIGPYKGIRVYDKAYNMDMSFTIRTSNSTWQVDGRDKFASNWLRYINMPTSAESENLKAYQYEGEVYFHAFRSIPPGSELLVWYGKAYARRLNIQYKKPKYTYGKDGLAGGNCLNSTSGIKCYGENAICFNKICLCTEGSHAPIGICIIDGSLDGNCKAGKCEGNHVVCSVRSNICICETGYLKYGGKCVKSKR